MGVISALSSYDNLEDYIIISAEQTKGGENAMGQLKSQAENSLRFILDLMNAVERGYCQRHAEWRGQCSSARLHAFDHRPDDQGQRQRWSGTGRPEAQKAPDKI